MERELQSSQHIRPLRYAEQTLLRSWYTKAVVYNLAHEKAVTWYTKLQKETNTAIVVSSLMASACSTFFKLPALAFALSLFAAVLISADAQMQCGKKSETHHYTTCKFRTLESKIKKLFQCKEVKGAGAAINIIRKEYDELLGFSPVLPNWIFKETMQELDECHELEVMDKPFKGDGKASQKQIPFSDQQLKRLQKRLAQALVNRKTTIALAVKMNTKAFYLATLMGSVACVATCLNCLSFASFSHLSIGPLRIEQKYIKKIGAIGSAALSALGAIKGRGGYFVMTKRLQDISTRWSSIRRDIEVLIYTQPHEDAADLVVKIEDKCTEFGDELKKAGMMKYFQHKESAKVKEELKKVQELWSEVERTAKVGYSPPELSIAGLMDPEQIP